jgi:hypothetical protein
LKFINSSKEEKAKSLNFKNKKIPNSNYNFGIWDLLFRIYYLGFGIWNLEFGIWDLGFELFSIHPLFSQQKSN